MLRLHEEAIQVLAGHVLVRKEVKPAVWPPGYKTTSRVVEVGVIRLLCSGTCRLRARRKQSYSCRSQDDFIRVWIFLNPTLALTSSPRCMVFQPHT